MAIRGTSYIRLVSDNTSPPNRIVELREAIGMSQAALARQIHCTPSALSKVETGDRKLDQLWMRRIANVLGVAPAELLPRVDNPWALSPEEKALIERLRAGSREDRDRFARVADAVIDWNGPPAEDAA